MSDYISYEDAASTSLCVLNGEYSNRLFVISIMVYIPITLFRLYFVVYRVIMASSFSMSEEDEITSTPTPPRPTRFSIDGEIRRQYRRFNTEGYLRYASYHLPTVITPCPISKPVCRNCLNTRYATYKTPISSVSRSVTKSMYRISR